MKLKTFTTSALLLAVASSGAWAKVGPAEAAKLGTELTLMGAEVAANATGTIPSYTGGLEADENADPMKDIFAHEKPLFTITSENLEQYKKNLTDGQIALFEKYPDTYKMPIYQTHRTAAFPQSVYNKAKKNATTADRKSVV